MELVVIQDVMLVTTAAVGLVICAIAVYLIRRAMLLPPSYRAHFFTNPATGPLALTRVGLGLRGIALLVFGLFVPSVVASSAWWPGLGGVLEASLVIIWITLIVAIVLDGHRGGRSSP